MFDNQQRKGHQLSMAIFIAILMYSALLGIWIYEVVNETPDSDRSVTLPGLLAGVAVVAGITILLA